MGVSGTTLHDLQLIQNAFASRLKFTMVITDSEGNYLTTPSLPSKQNALFEMEILREFVSKVSGFGINDKTFIVDNPYTPIQGLKCILSPIPLNKEIYFLWAGPLLTKGMKEMSINQLTPDQKRYKHYIKTKCEVTTNEIAKQIRNVEEINWLIRKFIDYDYKQNKTIQQFSLIESLFLQANVKNYFHEAIRGFLENFEEIGFIGYAERIDPFQYRVTEVFGDYNELLLTERFLIGEGFLGQAASSGQFKVWNSISSDERAFKFSKNGKPLQSLFCFPAKLEDQADTIIFGGSFHKGFDLQLTGLFRIMFSLFSYFETQAQLKKELSVSQTRLNILKDFSMTLSDVKDVNQVLHLLMDTSISLVKGSFTCVFLKQNKYNEQSKMVSKGLSSVNISIYGDYLKKKYFGKEGPTLKEPALLRMIDITLECPLKQGDEIIGVFCVGFTDKQVYEEFSHLLISFARIVSFALRLLFRKEVKMVEERRIKTLFQATENFDLFTFKIISEAKIILMEFTSYLQLDDNIRDLCWQALSLSAYRAEFLEKQNISKKIVQIVDELNFIKENGKIEAISQESQIIYLVLCYFLNQNNSETVYPEIFDLRLLDKFYDFLLKTKLKETIISENEQEVSASQSSLKIKFRLSEREEEVLDLIIKGANNKEIGNKLYISEHTVKNHLTNIFKKLNVRDRTQAIAKCYSFGYKYIEETN